MKFRIVLFIICLPCLIFSQKARKYSNEFMNIGVDAKALGMSKTVTAFTNDVNSGYWNPAGLVNLEDNELALMHASYFANIANYDYIGYAMPLDTESAVAISVIRFAVDDILDTTQLIDSEGNINYDRIKLFSTSDYGITFSYARNLPVQGLSYGINAKVIRRIIGDFANSWGVGFDAGIQFDTDNDWKFGLMARDITTTFNAWSFDNEKLEQIESAIEGQNQTPPEKTEITIPKLELGISKSFKIHYDYKIETGFNLNMRFTQTNDIISSSFISIAPALGFQASYIDMIYLRGGVGNFQNETQIDETQTLGFQPSFGVGFYYKGITIDYAFTDIGDQSIALYSNIFSLRINFDVFR